METNDMTMTTAPKNEPARRTYAPPRLTVHGTVSQLTAHTSGGPTDLKGGSLTDL